MASYTIANSNNFVRWKKTSGLSLADLQADGIPDIDDQVSELVPVSAYTFTELGSELEFDTDEAAQIFGGKLDGTHAVISWDSGSAGGGIKAQVFEVDTGSETITAKDSAIVVDSASAAGNNGLLIIDETHFIVFWQQGTTSSMRMFEVASDYSITAMDSEFVFDASDNSLDLTSVLIDASKFILFWNKPSDGSDGFTRVFDYNTGTGVITAYGS